MVNNQDDDLLLKANAFDRKAITEIYEAYQQPLYRYIYRQVGSVETARDLTSELFSRFLQAVKNGTGPTRQLKAWLYRVGHNTVVDYYRRQQHRDHLPLNDLFVDANEDPVRSAELNIDAERVRLALTRLTPDQRQVISLKFFAGFTNQEIAEVMDKPVGAVKALQHRAIAALQRQLVPMEEQAYL
ncbi:MAG: sigma-70 family RNA polymerase sigma factor [Anaerolineae bacterium]|nr:sigma-70 family RNA polymerase sigma factor [Anaerolineae bacterium]